MERIRLSKDEKYALRMLSRADASNWPYAVRQRLAVACRGLDEKGLAKSFFSEEDGLVDATIVTNRTFYIAP